MSGGESKVQCCKEQDCTETWNVRPINQGNLDVVKQEIARVNINILFQQHKMTIHMDILYTEIRLIIFFAAKDRKLYTVSKNKTWNWLWIRSSIPYYKFRIKLKEVGKIIRPFRYDPNKIPYNYTVEVTNRFKGLYLLECLKNYGWRFWTPYRR